MVIYLRIYLAENSNPNLDIKKYIVSEGLYAKTDLKFGLAGKFDKRRYGVTLWYTRQSFCHK